MEIKTVSYGKTYNRGNYESERFDATANVEPGETPEDALDSLHTWVQIQGGAESEMDYSRAEIRLKVAAEKQLLANLQSSVSEARQVWERASSFLQRHGLDVAKTIDDDIPF